MRKQRKNEEKPARERSRNGKKKGGRNVVEERLNSTKPLDDVKVQDSKL